MQTSPTDASNLSLRAPFAPGMPYEIDPERARKLLKVALRRGGDHADLFAEFSVGASMVLEEGIVKTASRGVSLGVGVVFAELWTRAFRSVSISPSLQAHSS